MTYRVPKRIPARRALESRSPVFQPRWWAENRDVPRPHVSTSRSYIVHPRRRPQSPRDPENLACPTDRAFNHVDIARSRCTTSGGDRSWSSSGRSALRLVNQIARVPRTRRCPASPAAPRGRLSASVPDVVRRSRSSPRSSRYAINKFGRLRGSSSRIAHTRASMCCLSKSMKTAPRTPGSPGPATACRVCRFRTCDQIGLEVFRYLHIVETMRQRRCCNQALEPASPRTPRWWSARIENLPRYHSLLPAILDKPADRAFIRRIPP